MIKRRIKIIKASDPAFWYARDYIGLEAPAEQDHKGRWLVRLTNSVIPHMFVDQRDFVFLDPEPIVLPDTLNLQPNEFLHIRVTRDDRLEFEIRGVLPHLKSHAWIDDGVYFIQFHEDLATIQTMIDEKYDLVARVEASIKLMAQELAIFKRHKFGVK